MQHVFLFFPQQLFTAFISVHVFLLSFNMVSPLPLTDSEDIEVFLPFDRHLPQANAVTIHRNVSQLDGNNTKLNSEYALVRQRRAAGCVRSKTVENCNGMLITTVKCKRRSVACLHGISANCSPVTTYYGRCGRTFVTNCLCASQVRFVYFVTIFSAQYNMNCTFDFDDRPVDCKIRLSDIQKLQCILNKTIVFRPNFSMKFNGH